MKRVLRWFIVSFCMLFVWPFFLYKKYGNKDYKLQGNTIIVSNHYATLDAFFIYMAFWKKRIRFVTIIDVKKKVISRFLAWLFDCLYLDYNTTNYRFFKECIKILKEGGIICIYPEGVVNPTKFGVFSFHGAFMYLAQKTNATILPLFVNPKMRFLKKSIVYIGDEITSEQYSKFKSRDEAVFYVQTTIVDYSFCEFT